ASGPLQRVRDGAPDARRQDHLGGPGEACGVLVPARVWSPAAWVAGAGARQPGRARAGRRGVVLRDQSLSPSYSPARTPAASGHSVATWPKFVSRIQCRSSRSSSLTLGDTATSTPPPADQNPF